jgi:hypothetical protein
MGSLSGSLFPVAHPPRAATTALQAKPKLGKALNYSGFPGGHQPFRIVVPV